MRKTATKNSRNNRGIRDSDSSSDISSTFKGVQASILGPVVKWCRSSFPTPDRVYQESERTEGIADGVEGGIVPVAHLHTQHHHDRGRTEEQRERIWCKYPGA